MSLNNRQARESQFLSGWRATISWWAGVASRRFRLRCSSLIQGLMGAGVKLAESVIKEAGIKLDENKATEGAGGGGTLKIVPYTVHQLSFGDIKEENVPGLYDGPFPWENMFGFHLAGMVGHDFFKPYAVTFDFQNMQIFLQTLSWSANLGCRERLSSPVFRPGIRFSIAVFHSLGGAQPQKIVGDPQSVLLLRCRSTRLCAVAAIHANAAKPGQHRSYSSTVVQLFWPMS